jgi:beta-lactam-binding protein with PASTA domain
MPLLFGEPLSTAVSRLKTDAIVLARVVDITGREVAPANPGDFAGTIVLAQLPSAGTSLPPGATVQLVVSAKLEVEETIEMPSLSGLTLAEVQRVLADLGLQLGTVKTLKTSPVPTPTPIPVPKPLPGETPPIIAKPGGEIA